MPRYMGAVLGAYAALLDAFRAGRLLFLGSPYPVEGSADGCGRRDRAKLEGGADKGFVEVERVDPRHG